MAEREQAHRHAVDVMLVKGGDRSEMVGLCVAAFLATIAITGALYLLYLGREIAGLGTLIAVLATLAGVFVLKKSGSNDGAKRETE